MTIEQFLKYAVEMCQKCSDNECEKCEASPGEGLYVGTLLTLIFLKLNK